MKQDPHEWYILKRCYIIIPITILSTYLKRIRSTSPANWRTPSAPSASSRWGRSSWSPGRCLSPPSKCRTPTAGRHLIDRTEDLDIKYNYSRRGSIATYIFLRTDSTIGYWDYVLVYVSPWRTYIQSWSSQVLHTYVHTCIHTYMHRFTFVFIYVNTFIHTYTHTQKTNSEMLIHT